MIIVGLLVEVVAPTYGCAKTASLKKVSNFSVGIAILLNMFMVSVLINILLINSFDGEGTYLSIMLMQHETTN